MGCSFSPPPTRRGQSGLAKMEERVCCTRNPHSNCSQTTSAARTEGFQERLDSCWWRLGHPRGAASFLSDGGGNPTSSITVSETSEDYVLAIGRTGGTRGCGTPELRVPARSLDFIPSRVLPGTPYFCSRTLSVVNAITKALFHTVQVMAGQALNCFSASQ